MLTDPSIATAVAGIGMISYLILNWKMTGYLTGQPRGAPEDNIKELLINICMYQFEEMSNVFMVFYKMDGFLPASPLWLCFFAFVLYAVFKKYDLIKIRDKNIIVPLTFFAVGGLYWCSIVASLFSTYISTISRLLFPASMLLFIGFAGLLACHEKIKKYFLRFSGFSVSSDAIGKCGKSEHISAGLFVSFFVLFIMTKLVLMPVAASCSAPSSISSLIDLSVPPLAESSVPYRSAKESLLRKYADIPDGSTLLWGFAEYSHDDRFLSFLRDDIESRERVYPRDDETQEAFLNSFGARKIFVYVPGMKKYMDDDFKNHKPFAEFFEQYRNSGETFIRIK